MAFANAMNATTTDALISCPLNLPLAAFNCTHPYPNCTSPVGFEFEALWQISKFIATCASDPRLFEKGSELLSNDGCKALVGGDGFTYYPGEDIWTRLTTWKFPLLQLVAIFPRAPLSISSQMHTIVSLLGNPVSAIRSLLLKLASCEDRARYWRHQLRDEIDLPAVATGRETSAARDARLWKAFALITDTYDEWGRHCGDAACDFLHERLLSTRIDRKKFIKICEETAATLAADRATKSLPVIVAQGFFIGAIAIAVAKTPEAASGPNPGTFINIEAHSIAFSILYFWILPVVIVGSVIGASQTEISIPRTLVQFQTNLDNAFPGRDMKLPNGFLEDIDGELNPATLLRERNGGVYTYEPAKLCNQLRAIETKRVQQLPPDSWAKKVPFVRRTCEWSSRPGSPLLPHIVLLCCLFGGLLITALIPPAGFGSRNIAQLAMVLYWIANGALDYIPWSERYRPYQFWFNFSKDLLSTCVTMGIIIATQLGVLNRCSAYTLWGRTGLQLPEIGSNVQVLNHGIKTTYPAIAFLCIAMNLIVFPAIIFYQYSSAMRVYLQRDDAKSNCDWLPRSWRVRLFDGSCRHNKGSSIAMSETSDDSRGKLSPELGVSVVHMEHVDRSSEEV